MRDVKSYSVISPFEGTVWPSCTFYPLVVPQDFTGSEPSRYIPPRIRVVLAFVNANLRLYFDHRLTLSETLATVEKSMTPS